MLDVSEHAPLSPMLASPISLHVEGLFLHRGLLASSSNDTAAENLSFGLVEK